MPRWKGWRDNRGARREEDLGDADGCGAVYLAADEHPAIRMSSPAPATRALGQFNGLVRLGFGPDGKRIRRKVSGKSRAVVQDRLKTLHGDLHSGVRASPNYTVRRAAED